MRPTGRWHRRLWQFKAQLVREAMHRNGRNITRAARWLGVTRPYLSNLITELTPRTRRITPQSSGWAARNAARADRPLWDAMMATYQQGRQLDSKQ